MLSSLTINYVEARDYATFRCYDALFNYIDAAFTETSI